MTTEFMLFSDYHHVLLLDSESTNDVSRAWFDSAVYGLALTEDAIGIVTGVNDDVIVAIEVMAGPPADGDTYEAVLECSMRASSGTLRLTSPTYGDDDGDRVTVPPGWLRLRISLTKHPDTAEENDDPQRLLIECWPAEPAGPILLKG